MIPVPLYLPSLLTGLKTLLVEYGCHGDAIDILHDDDNHFEPEAFVPGVTMYRTSPKSPLWRYDQVLPSRDRYYGAALTQMTTDLAWHQLYYRSARRVPQVMTSPEQAVRMHEALTHQLSDTSIPKPTPLEFETVPMRRLEQATAAFDKLEIGQDATAVERLNRHRPYHAFAVKPGSLHADLDPNFPMPAMTTTPTNIAGSIRRLLRCAGIELQHAAILELTARLFGNRDWHHWQQQSKRPICREIPYVLFSLDGENTTKFYRTAEEAVAAAMDWPLGDNNRWLLRSDKGGIEMMDERETTGLVRAYLYQVPIWSRTETAVTAISAETPSIHFSNLKGGMGKTYNPDLKTPHELGLLQIDF